MRRNLACLAVATLSLVVVFVACKSGPTLPPATAGGGFIIQTIYVSPSGPFAVVAGGVNILSSWVADVTGATGDPSAINVTTTPEGLASAAGKRAPAVWDFTWAGGGPDPACAAARNNPVQETVYVNAIQDITCFYSPTSVVEEGEALTFSPGRLYESKLPSSVSGKASGISSQYGMPVLQYFDLTGTLIAQTSASSATSSSITAATPNLSTVPTGTYGGLIQNVENSGSYSPVGGGAEFVVAPPGYATYTATAESCPYTKWTVYSNWVYHDASGVTHVYLNVSVSNFNGAPCGTQPASSVYATSTDGVGMHIMATPSATLTSNDTAVPVRPGF